MRVASFVPWLGEERLPFGHGIWGCGRRCRLACCWPHGGAGMGSTSSIVWQQCVALAGQPACPQETVHILSLAQSTAGLWIQPREDPSGCVSLEITRIVLCIEDLTSQISLPKNVGSVSLSCSR